MFSIGVCLLGRAYGRIKNSKQKDTATYAIEPSMLYAMQSQLNTNGFHCFYYFENYFLLRQQYDDNGNGVKAEDIVSAKIWGIFFPTSKQVSAYIQLRN